MSEKDFEWFENGPMDVTTSDPQVGSAELECLPLLGGELAPT